MDLVGSAHRRVGDPWRVTRTPYLDHPGPIALAHRGFSLQGRENSMEAFAAAVDLGFRYVETDVHATRDGVAVAFHDATLDRTTDRTGAIAAMPWSYVRSARVVGGPATGGPEGGGAQGDGGVPALEDLLGAWPDLRVNIDVKAASAVGPTVEVVERVRAHDRVCIASFSDARRRAVLAALSRPVATSAGSGTVVRFRAVTSSSTASRRVLRGVDCLQVPERQGGVTVVTRRTVAAAHAAGVQVHVWTVNAAEHMHRLLDLGVDGIVTDRADVLRDVLVARGSWV